MTHPLYALGTTRDETPLAAVGRTARAAPFPVRPGFAFLLWNGSSPASAWAKQRAYVARIQPQVLMYHTGWGGARAELTPVLRDARATVPGLRLWGEFACAPTAVRACIDTARRFVEVHGAELLSLNGEKAFKVVAPGAASSGARAIVEGIAKHHPDVPLMLTTYPRPGEQPRFPYAAFCNGKDATGDWRAAGLPGCTVFGPQVYTIPDDQKVVQAEGVLGRSLAKMFASVADAQGRGRMRKDLALCGFFASKWMRAPEVIAAARTVSSSTFWPWHSGYDEAGLVAARAIADAYR